MKYLIIDASLNGTGIRDYYQGGYIYPEDLNLSIGIIKRIQKWLSDYANEHYIGYTNENLIDNLDNEGKNISLIIKNELKDVKVEYYSDARMIRLII